MWTEEDGSTILKRRIDIFVPDGHTFWLLEPLPPFPVNVLDPYDDGHRDRWVIAFEFETSNGDSRGQIETIPHADGDILPVTREFAHSHGQVSFKAH